MARDLDRQKQFTRRALLLGGGQGAAAGGAVPAGCTTCRCVEAERYLTLAEDNRINLRLLPPPRGRILDRCGRPLAINRQDYRAGPGRRAGRRRRGDACRLLSTLVAVQRQRPQAGAARDRPPAQLRAGHGPRQSELGGCRPHRGQLARSAGRRHRGRAEPRVSVRRRCCRTSSAMSPRSPRPTPDGDPLLQLPGFRIGKAGIEKRYETRAARRRRQLRGRGQRRRPRRSASSIARRASPAPI